MKILSHIYFFLCVVGKRYEYLSSSGQQHEALAECKKRGGTLASIDNVEENETIVLMIGNNKAWIGATDKEVSFFVTL